MNFNGKFLIFHHWHLLGKPLALCCQDKAHTYGQNLVKRGNDALDIYSPQNKKNLPVKNDGWKTSLSFSNGPFSRDIRSFSGGGGGI